MKYALLLVALVFGVGCNAVQSPTAMVRGAQLGKVTPEGMMLNLDMTVSNPNAVSIPLTKMSYDMRLGGADGAKLLDGTANPSTSIPANGSAPVTVPVQIRWEDLLNVKDALVSGGGNVPYTLSGKLSAGGGIPLIGEQSVPLSYSGTLPLKEALRDPQALVQSPAARELARRVLGQVGGFGF